MMHYALAIIDDTEAVQVLVPFLLKGKDQFIEARPNDNLALITKKLGDTLFLAVCAAAAAYAGDHDTPRAALDDAMDKQEQGDG